MFIKQNTIPDFGVFSTTAVGSYQFLKAGSNSPAIGGGSITNPATNVYKIQLGSGETDTFGDLTIILLDGGGTMLGIVNHEVVAFDPADAVHLGLSALPNAAAGAATGVMVNGLNQGGATFTGTLSFTGSLLIAGAAGNPGLQISGSTTTPALKLVGGSTSGAGLAITTTSGDGIAVTPTAGHGLVLTANGTSKHGAVLTGGTAGTSDGLKCVAGTGGADLRAVLTDLAASAVNDILDAANGVESSKTLRQALRLILAALAGKLSGASGTSITIRDTNDTKNRISATVDSSGNRSAVTYDVS